MDKLKTLLLRCKCGVYLTVNQHRDYYMSVADYISEEKGSGRIIDEVSKKIANEMIKRDTIVELQYYPNTPIGFNIVYHYDLDEALDEALNEKQMKSSGGEDV